MALSSDENIFVQFRKVICGLYFSGFQNDDACRVCSDKKRCHRLVNDALNFTENLAKSKKKSDQVSDACNARNKA